MALAVVNTNSATNIGSSVSQASTTLAFPGAVTAGSTLVAMGFSYNDTGVAITAPAVSDGTNGAWTVRFIQNSISIDLNISAFIAYFQNSAGGVTPTVTWDPSGSAFMGGFWIGEVTGAAAASVDVTPAISVQTATTAFSIASGTLAQANEIIFAVMSSDFPNARTITPDATYTQAVEFEDNAASQAGNAQYKIVASTTSDTADWTISGAAANGISGLVSFKDSGGGAVASKPYTLTLLGMN